MEEGIQGGKNRLDRALFPRPIPSMLSLSTHFFVYFKEEERPLEGRKAVHSIFSIFKAKGALQRALRPSLHVRAPLHTSFACCSKVQLCALISRAMERAFKQASCAGRHDAKTDEATPRQSAFWSCSVRTQASIYALISVLSPPPSVLKV